MKTLKDQLSNYCKHFTGIQNKQCSAGVKYEDVKDKSTKPYGLPCLKDGGLTGGTCAKACWKTSEEVEAEVKEFIEKEKKQRIAYAAVKKHIEKTGENKGKIKCTSCGGILNYTRASINGHIWAKCKCGLGWME